MNTLSAVLFACIPVFAVLDWVAVARQDKRLEYFAKPATTTALLAWFVASAGLQGQALWFALGFLFSLGGDVFLMLPKDRFILGLVSFLIGHVCYLIGFNPSLPPANLPMTILGVLVGIVAVRAYRGIAAGLLRSGKQRLRLPVLVYSLALSLMLLSALSTLVRPEWQASAALLASSGALFFYVSDIILAWDKFVHPVRRARLLTMITYHLGQALIAIGVILRL
jgi:uncharacterized membrane protein YhhN